MPPSAQALLPVDTLIDRLLASAQQELLTTESCTLAEARGRVLATSVVSEMNVPPFDNSAMDGYALRWQADLVGRSLPVSHATFAGQAGSALPANHAVRILTGAPLPQGADTVIMQENVTCNNLNNTDPSSPLVIQINEQPRLGENIRRAGEDIARGSTVLAAGIRIGAAEIGLLASLGIASVQVYRQLRVSVIATGDELVAAGQPLAQGQIYNSNAPLLSALLDLLHVTIVRAVHVPDQPQQLQEILQLAASDSDLILTTGGASVGDADHLKSVLTQIGRIENWKIAIKPGKPLVWGEVTLPAGQNATQQSMTQQNIPLMGLPGNPQSVWVTFLIVVLPYLKALQGQRLRLNPHMLKVPAGFTRSKAQGRREYLRVQLQDGQLVTHPNQSSGALASASWADGFAVIEVGQTVALGDLVGYLPMSGLLE